VTFFRIDESGETLVIAIDRPPLNALTVELLEKGIEHLQVLAAAPPNAGIVVTGHGTAFTAGVDTKAAAALDREGRIRLSAAVDRFAAALYRLPCAVACAVNGHAIGAGGIICLASDWTVIADARLKIGLPEAKAGLPFPRVPTLIMDYQLDPVWRRRLALTSMLLGPHEAVTAGLADQVADPAALRDIAIAKAAELESQPAFRQIKRDQRRRGLAELDTILPARV
jgi:enoyl-CoA hydratase